jgi:hypothetical protein
MAIALPASVAKAMISDPDTKQFQPAGSRRQTAALRCPSHLVLKPFE